MEQKAKDEYRLQLWVEALLKIAVGACAMLCTNIDTRSGLVNVARECSRGYSDGN